MNKFLRILILVCLMGGVGLTSLQAEILSEEDFNRFMTFYYQSDAYEEVPAALEYFLKSDLYDESKSRDAHVIEMTAYFFGRISEMHPHLIRTYQEIFELATAEDQKFILMIFAFYRDSVTTAYLETYLSEHPESSNKLTLETVLANEPLRRESFVRPVDEYNDLDFLWVEYFITGEDQPVEEIVNVLGWKDVFSIRLLDWMLKEKTQEEIDLMTSLLNKSLGLTIDVDSLTSNTAQDLDVLFSIFLQYSGSVQESTGLASAIREGLKLSDEDILWMATKGAAVWSLQSNAKNHVKVREILKGQAAKRTDKVKRELEIILEVLKKEGQND